MRKSIFTSECVSIGHPDRLCDTVANRILDECLKQDPQAHVGLEMLVTKNHMTLSGEVSLKGDVPNYEKIARETVEAIGYNDASYNFDSKTFEFVNRVNTQSPDIAQGVNLSNEIGAGDQGIMFGYATNETDAYLPVTAFVANALMYRYQEVYSENLDTLSPDAKSQVTYDYVTKEFDTIVIAASHKKGCEELAKALVFNQVIVPVLAAFKGISVNEAQNFIAKSGIKVYINNTGKFEICGPASDAGVVGRKLVVDSYGGAAPIGGGCTNGKDPSKVDASAARAARHAALNIVASGLCSECLIQLSYAIGKAEPVSICAECEDLVPGVTNEDIEEWLSYNYDFSVQSIVKNLQLDKPVYGSLTYTGQFGQNSALFSQLSKGHNVEIPSWERFDLVEDLKEDFAKYL